MSNQFLAAARIGRYLTRLIDQSPITTAVPSTAKHLNYADADKLVQRLKSAGFPDAHVCTIKGLPATPEDIWESESSAAPQESPSTKQ
jgi:hypothetical protein